MDHKNTSHDNSSEIHFSDTLTNENLHSFLGSTAFFDADNKQAPGIVFSEKIISITNEGDTNLIKEIVSFFANKDKDKKSRYNSRQRISVRFNNCRFTENLESYWGLNGQASLSIEVIDCKIENHLAFSNCELDSLVVRGTTAKTISLNCVGVSGLLEITKCAIDEYILIDDCRLQDNTSIKRIALTKDHGTQAGFISVENCEINNFYIDIENKEIDFLINDSRVDSMNVGYGSEFGSFRVTRCIFCEKVNFYHFSPSANSTWESVEFPKGLEWDNSSLNSCELISLYGPDLKFGKNINVHKKENAPSGRVGALLKRLKLLLGLGGDFRGWEAVRSIGNLMIFTRASYISLIVIPVLCGVWPAVRSVANQWSSSGERISDNLGVLVERADAHQIIKQDQIDRLELAIADLKSRFSHVSPRFPWSLALTWTAALLATLAHLLYESSSPARVRKQSQEEYAQEKTNEFAESSSDPADHLAWALHSISQLASKFPGQHHPNFILRHGVITYLPTEIGPLLRDGVQIRDRTPVKELTPKNSKQMVAINEGARAQYRIDSQSNIKLSAVCFALYTISVILISCVLTRQLVLIWRSTIIG